MDAKELARRIVVRYREQGHLRLELPPAICHSAAAQAMEQSLRNVAGVYRVAVEIPQRRLIIRYDAHVCTAATVALALKASLAKLPSATAASGAESDEAASSLPDMPGMPDLVRQARQVFAQLRKGIKGLRQPSATPGSVQARLQPVLASALTEKAITNFLNDLIAFYLIRVHWELISKRWLQEPLKHTNAWATVFYLVFLLVRYRKSIAKVTPPTPAPTAQP